MRVFLKSSPVIKGGEAESCLHFRFTAAAKMMSFFPLLLVGILFPAVQAKQLTKCALSHELNDLAGYRDITLPECEFSIPSFQSISCLSLFCPHFLISSLPLSLHYLIIFWYFQLMFYSFFQFVLLSFLPVSDAFWNCLQIIKIVYALSYPLEID